MHIRTTTNGSVINIDNLLSDETIQYRVRTVINGTAQTNTDYSPYYDVSVIKASEAEVSGIVILIVIIIVKFFRYRYTTGNTIDAELSVHLKNMSTLPFFNRFYP